MNRDLLDGKIMSTIVFSLSKEGRTVARQQFFECIKSPKELEIEFQSKLSMAVEIIKQNKSFIAEKVLAVIYEGKIAIKSFWGLSKKDYFEIKKHYMETHNSLLPEYFSLTVPTVNAIALKLQGIILNDKNIYIAPNKNENQIATILVHEISHFMNLALCEEEELSEESDVVMFRDEIRSFTAEKMFQLNGGCLRRSHIKEIHKTVCKLYSEFNVSEALSSSMGYVSSALDPKF